MVKTYGKRKRASTTYKPRKRVFTKKKFYKRRRANIPTGVGSQKQKIVKLRYCIINELDVEPGGSAVSLFFRANGPYDPEYAVGGHQPMGFDQMSLLYNHYVVLGSKVTATFTPRIANTSGAAVVSGIEITDDAVVTTVPRHTILEQRKGLYRTVTTSNNKPFTLSRKFSAKRFFNVKDVKDNVTRIGAPNAALPAEEAFFRIFMMSGDVNVADDPPSFNVLVTVDYIILWSEPKELASS